MPARLQHCVYVLLSLHDRNFYVGRTTDLKRRLTECFLVSGDAERRERYRKTTGGRKGLKLMLRETRASRVWD